MHRTLCTYVNTSTKQTIENEFNVAISAEKSVSSNVSQPSTSSSMAAATTTSRQPPPQMSVESSMAPSNEKACLETTEQPTKPPRQKPKSFQQPVEMTTIDNLDDGNDVSFPVCGFGLTTNTLRRLRSVIVSHLA